MNRYDLLIMDSNKIEDLNDILAHSSYLIKFLAYYCKFYFWFY